MEEDSEGKGGMLFDTQTAVICACNASSWVLVEAMRIGTELADLVELLEKQFEVDRQTARKDILSLVKELRTLDMLDSS